jgi:hypothetical protein
MHLCSFKPIEIISEYRFKELNEWAIISFVYDNFVEINIYLIIVIERIRSFRQLSNFFSCKFTI